MLLYNLNSDLMILRNVKGQFIKGNKFSEEIESVRRKNISIGLKSLHLHRSEESKQNLRNAALKQFKEKGHPFTGLSHSLETRNKIRQKLLGRKRSIESIIKGSEKNKGRIVSQGTREKIRQKVTGYHHTEETKIKIREARKTQVFTKEHIRKVLRRNPKSSLEIKFEEIIQKFNLPYKFVGNGSFFIERKCPDFINTNGQKIAIEVYYRRHKQEFRNTSIDQWKQNRQNIFRKYGWNIIFFDETEVNEENVLKILNN